MVRRIQYTTKDKPKDVAENLVRAYRMQLDILKQRVKEDKHIDTPSIEMEVFKREDKYYADISLMYGLPRRIFTLGNKTGAKLFGISLTEAEVKSIRRVEEIIKEKWDIIKKYDKDIEGKEWLIEEGAIQATWLDDKNFEYYVGDNYFSFVNKGIYEDSGYSDEKCIEILQDFGRDGIKICKLLNSFVNDLDYEPWAVCHETLKVTKEDDGYRIRLYNDKIKGPLAIFYGNGIVVKNYEEFEKGFCAKYSIDDD